MTQIAQTNNKPANKIDILKSIMKAESVQEQFKNALAENSGAFVASVIDLYNGDTNLQNCEPKAVVMEALKAATLKLPINRSLGFAYIVPYNNNRKDQNGNWQKIVTPQMQIGYKGLIQLAMRTGQYKFINADVVYDGEVRTVNKLTGEIDFTGEKKSEKVVGYFSYIELLNGFSKTLYMTKEKVDAHAKKYSKSFGANGSPWTVNYEDMALKTVLKGLLGRYGYLSVEMMNAFDHDQEHEDTEVRDRANTKTIGFDDAEDVTAQAPVTENEPEVATIDPGF